MGFASIIPERIAALVHPGVRGEVERTRHALFIGLHLLPSLLALLAIPVRLAHGAPSLWEIAGALLLQSPAVAACVLARGGTLRTAEAVSAFGSIAFGCLVAFAAPPWTAVTACVFATAVFELAGSFSRRTGAATLIGLFVALTAASMIGVALVPSAPGDADDALAKALAVSAILGYAGALAWGASWLRRLQQDKAAGEAARLRALSSVVGDLVLQIDRRGIVLSCGAEAGPVFALTPRDLSGRGFYERVHLADRPTFLQAVADAFDHVAMPVVMLRLRTATVRSTRGAFEEPVFRTVEARMRRIDHADAPGASHHPAAVCLIRDVSQQAEREDAFAAAQRAAEQAGETRERFLANVSHELRTPLNAIIGFADLLQMDKVVKDEGRRAEYAAIISASGHHLLSVVNSILDMSKLEAGSFDIEPTRFEPAALLDGCLDIVKLKAAETGVRLVRDYDRSLSPIVGDERACRQIVINLLSNAVKFTPKAGIVTLSARSDFGLAITVEDTGIGIAACDMPQLGNAFFQASNARSRLFEGTGLGLSLVRGLVGLHGGTMDVASAPGSGTTVTVSLPRDCRDAAPSRTPVTIHTISRAAPMLHGPLPDKVKNIA